MKERTIKGILSIIPTILMLLCILAAFATNDWNIGSTLAFEDPEETAEKLLSNFGFGEGFIDEDVIQVKDFRLSQDGRKIFLEVVFNSPLDVPMTVKELSFVYNIGNSDITLSLPSEVVVPAKGSADLNLEGNLPLAESMANLHSGKTPSLRNIRIKLDIEGMELGVVT